MAYTRLELAEALKPYVVPGGHLMVHSSYKSLGGIEGGAHTVIDTLLDLLGKNGTLLIPTFTLDAWAQDHYFDINETASITGILGELARKRPEFLRTFHPMYNFAVAGDCQVQYMLQDDHDAFGHDSVYGLFHRANGRILSIGLRDPDYTLSQAHYNEQWARAVYRYRKHFSGIYVDYEGEPRLDTYSMYVRLTQKHKTRLNPGTDILKRNGVIKLCMILEAESCYTDSQDYYNAMVPLVQSDPDLWYEAPRV